MNGNWEDNFTGESIRKHSVGIPKGKINGLLSELLEKEDEIKIYKNRLKELETAFYYNLELISERDLELSILEKQLGSENKQLKVLIREKNELEDLIKVINNRNSKKIKQLETKLSEKEEEIRDLQREKIEKISSMKKLISDVKRHEEKKIDKMITEFEIQKSELIKSFEEEIEGKEKYYILEIDNLTEKLEKAYVEKNELDKEEEENRNRVEELKKLFIEKENQYLEEIKKINNSSVRKVSREIQCNFKPQVLEKEVQAQPDNKTGNSQTSQLTFDIPNEYIEKINFLQEQNEVLKYIVKDLKRSREVSFGNPDKPPGCECLQIRTEINQINNKFESEINNLKDILKEEQKRRQEEDAVIQSLETSVTCFKDKLLSGLQEKLQNFQGEDICTYTYNREIQNEIHVTLLEEKLNTKMDALMTSAEEENKKFHKKLEEIQEWTNKIEKFMKPQEQSEMRSENLLEKIRVEIQKLENKIETDMKNLIRNNNSNKCDKNFQARVEHPRPKRVTFAEEPCGVPPEVLLPAKEFTPRDFINSREVYYRNNLSPEKCISFFKCNPESKNHLKKKSGEQKEFRKVTNTLLMGR